MMLNQFMMMMMSFNLNHVMSLIRRKIEGKHEEKEKDSGKGEQRLGSKKEEERDDGVFS